MSHSHEEELLRRVEAVLGSAEVDVSGLVEEAWDEARAEVSGALRRLMVRDLLRRAERHLSRPAPEDAPGRPPTETGTGTYLFAILSGDREVPVEDLPPLPGAGPLRTVAVEGLAAVVADVEIESFSALREPGPGSLELLATVAQAHDAILSGLAADGAVLPLRLGTVLPDDAALTDLIREHAPHLREGLERVTGHREWAVTTHRLEDDHDSAGAVRTAASGRDYLESQQATLEAKRRRRTERDQLAGTIHERLSDQATASERVARRPLEEVAPPLLHGVYLVADEDWDRFEATIADLRAEHPDAMIDLSGPWPPYHFTTVELGGDTGPPS